MAEYKVGDLSKLFQSTPLKNDSSNIFQKKTKNITPVSKDVKKITKQKLKKRKTKPDGEKQDPLTPDSKDVKKKTKHKLKKRKTKPDGEKQDPLKKSSEQEVPKKKSSEQEVLKKKGKKKGNKKTTLYGAAHRVQRLKKNQLKSLSGTPKQTSEVKGDDKKKKHKGKRKIPEDKNIQDKSLVLKKQKIVHEEQQNTDNSDSSSDEEVNGEGRDAGFCPPAGIVHESLTEKGKKRKLQSDDSDTSEDETSPSKKQNMDDDGSDSDSDDDGDNEDNDGSENDENNVDDDNEKDDDKNNEQKIEDGKNGTDSDKKSTRMRRDRLAKATNDRTVFVGNLSLEITAKKLGNLFKQCGEIEAVRYRCLPVKDPRVPKKVVAIKKEFHPERHNCVGYVCFKEKESAQKALSLNGKDVNGLHIRVDMATKTKMTDVKNSVFVGNLPFDIEEETVRQHFEDCGSVQDVRLIRDKLTCLGKGFGYIMFEDADGVSFALKLNGSKLRGREIRVMNCSKDKLTKKKDKMSKNIEIKKKKQEKTTMAKKMLPSKVAETQYGGEIAKKDKKKKKPKKASSSGKTKVFFNTKEKPDKLKESIQSLIDSEKKKSPAINGAQTKPGKVNEKKQKPKKKEAAVNQPEKGSPKKIDKTSTPIPSVGSKGKTFDNTGKKSFEQKGNKSFGNKGNMTFDKGNKSFDMGKKSFDKGNKSFDKGNKSFDMGKKSFSNEGHKSFGNKSFEKPEGKPFERRGGKPFDKFGNKSFDGKANRSFGDRSYGNKTFDKKPGFQSKNFNKSFDSGLKSNSLPAGSGKHTKFDD